MSDKLDLFKYWTSYRTEGGIERGIANIPLNDQNFIQDTAPFVTYKEAIPANRIVVKMQTNVGDLDLGPFVQDNTNVADPFFGEGISILNTKYICFLGKVAKALFLILNTFEQISPIYLWTKQRRLGVV